MGRKVKQLKNYTSEQVEALFESDENNRTGVKLYAVIQLCRGYSSRKPEEFYRTSFKQICNWADRFDAEGIDGLRIKPGRSRHSRLNEDRKYQLQGDLLKSPESFGYNTAGRSGPLLREHIRKTHRVDYKPAAVYNLMHVGFQFSTGQSLLSRAKRSQTSGSRRTYKKTSDYCAGHQDTVILFGDEFSLSNTATLASGRTPVGEQPVISRKQNRKERVTGFGAVNPLNRTTGC